MATAGYSGTPLPKKLGIKEGSRVLVMGAPSTFDLDELESVAGRKIQAAPSKAGHDVALIFVRERKKLVAAFKKVAAALDEAGGLWIAWPKKSSGLATDITEDCLREDLLPTGYVDNKVCAIDETWSGLRFVLRKENRRKR